MAKFNPFLLAPPALFFGLAVMFYVGLNRGDPNALPTMFENKPAPEIDLTALGGGPIPTNEDLSADGVKLVNFWASWCGPCRVEHPMLEEMSQNGITIIGIDYKDNPDNALRFLAQLGNPYAKLGADFNGRTAIDWGVTGVPETFVIDGSGTILMRHSGPITRAIYDNTIAPVIAGAAQE